MLFSRASISPVEEAWSVAGSMNFGRMYDVSGSLITEHARGAVALQSSEQGCTLRGGKGVHA